MKRAVRNFSWVGSLTVLGALMVSSCGEKETQTETSAPVEEAGQPLAESPEPARQAAQSVEGAKRNQPKTAKYVDEAAEIEFMKQIKAKGKETPAEALRMIVEAPQSPRRLNTVRDVMTQWAQDDLQAAKEAADALAPDSRAKTAARLAVVSASSEDQLGSTQDWVASWADDEMEKGLATEMIKSRLDPQEPHVCGPDCVEHQ